MKKLLMMILLAATLIDSHGYAQDAAAINDGQDGTDQSADTSDDTSSDSSADTSKPAAPVRSGAAAADDNVPAGKTKRAGKGGGNNKKGNKKNKKEAVSATQEMVRKLRNQDGPKRTYKQLMMAINRQATLHSFANLLRRTGLNYPLRAYNFVKSADALRGKRAKKYIDLIPLGTELTVFAPEAIKIEPLVQEVVRANQALRGKDKEAGKEQHEEVVKKVKEQMEACIVKGRYLFADLPDELTTLAGTKIQPKSMMFSRKDILAGNGVLFITGHVQEGAGRSRDGKRSVAGAVAQIKDRVKASNAAVLAQEQAHHDAMKALAHKDDPKPAQDDRGGEATDDGSDAATDDGKDAKPATTADAKVVAATSTSATTTPAPAAGSAVMPGTTIAAHGGTSNPAAGDAADDGGDDSSGTDDGGSDDGSDAAAA